MTVDDMVLEWREVRLDKDTKSNCASGGACATIDTASTNFYQGQARLLVTVLDTSPHLSGKNNCDLDFVCSNNPAISCKQDSDCGTGNTCNQDFSDAWDDTDCDNNGVEDVVVKAYNLDEPNGELAVLNK